MTDEQFADELIELALRRGQLVSIVRDRRLWIGFPSFEAAIALDAFTAGRLVEELQRALAGADEPAASGLEVAQRLNARLSASSESKFVATRALGEVWFAVRDLGVTSFSLRTAERMIREFQLAEPS